jgi:hypothetical protein
VRTTHDILLRLWVCSLRCVKTLVSHWLLLETVCSQILLRHLIVRNWICASLSLHTTLSTWASCLSAPVLGLRLNVTTFLGRCISRQIHSAISAVCFFLDDSSAFVSNELAVGPVSSLHLGENAHAFVAYLKGTDAGHLLEVWTGLVFVLDQVVVKVEVEVRLWNLVLHHDRVRNPVDDGSGLPLEKFDVFGLIVARAPSMFLAVLATLDHEN